MKQVLKESPFFQKHLLTLADYSPADVETILARACKLKKDLKEGVVSPLLSGKNLAMIFAKPSTRTRVSFEVGMQQLGGHALFLSSHDIQLGRGEPIADTAKVLSRFVDGIMIRTFSQDDVENLAAQSSIPVINGLTDIWHPCQVLADLLTIYEYKGRLKGLKMAFLGDGFNMAHSLMMGGAKTGMEVVVACPTEYLPNPVIVEVAKKAAAETEGKITVTNDPVAAILNADVVLTDVFTSMGQEQETVQRLEAFAPYQVNEQLFSLAKLDAIFLHCLPAHRGEEVTSSVIDGPHSVIYDEAENRLHAQKAVMCLLMGDKT
ncbi:MAG: ornithine carbamoyltransferase [Christensenellales bacterium]